MTDAYREDGEFLWARTDPEGNVVEYGVRFPEPLPEGTEVFDRGTGEHIGIIASVRSV